MLHGAWRRKGGKKDAYRINIHELVKQLTGSFWSYVGCVLLLLTLAQGLSREADSIQCIEPPGGPFEMADYYIVLLLVAKCSARISCHTRQRHLHPQPDLLQNQLRSSPKVSLIRPFRFS